MPNGMDTRMKEKGNPTVDYHRENYGENFTYDDFIPIWKAENFDPSEWARFAKKDGSKIYLHYFKASRRILSVANKVY